MVILIALNIILYYGQVTKIIVNTCKTKQSKRENWGISANISRLYYIQIIFTLIYINKCDQNKFILF